MEVHFNVSEWYKYSFVLGNKTQFGSLKIVKMKLGFFGDGENGNFSDYHSFTYWSRKNSLVFFLVLRFIKVLVKTEFISTVAHILICVKKRNFILRQGLKVFS